MRYFIVIVASLAFTHLAFSQISEKRYVGDKDSQGRRTGVWKTYIGNTLFETQEYKEGREEGTFTRYNVWNDEDKTVILQKGQYLNSKRVGDWRSYHPNGKVSEEGKYIKGTKSGAWRKYAEGSGNLIEISNYLDNELSGEYKYFWAAGVVTKSGNYLSGKKIGEWIEYHVDRDTRERFVTKIEIYNLKGDTVGTWKENFYAEKDKIKILKTYDERGILNGPYEENDFGGLVAKGNYSNGLREGIWEFGSDDDNVWREIFEYTAGKRNGLYEKKQSSGITLSKGTYSNDLKTGLWQEADNRGVVGKGNYTNNMRTGVWKFYSSSNQNLIGEMQYGSKEVVLVNKQFYEDGTLGKEITNNLEDGSVQYKEFYPNKKLKVEGQSRNNKQFGEWKEYYDTGQLARKTNYKNGIPNGNYEIYYPNGNLKMKAGFNEGKLWNVSELKDLNGNKLEPGTINNGNGTFIEYDENGKLLKVLNFIDGQVQN